MKHTSEQTEILDFARSRSESMIVESLAGTGKTTTGVLIAHALPLVPILGIAFNKNIATELQKRMPAHVTVKTANALCHGAWLKHIGKFKARVDSSKGYTILKEIIDELSPMEQKGARKKFTSILRAISFAKTNGYVPQAFRNVGETLIELDDFIELVAPTLDDEVDDMVPIIELALERSIAASYSAYIDFDDQVYMACLFGAPFPRYPIVIVDEAQDLSPLNHVMIERLKPDRLIAIGDPWQSIYAFRGADGEAIPKLTKRFGAQKLTLSVSFRVPKVGVRNAWFRVPHFTWKSDAEEGTISSLGEWGGDHIADSAAIICRNNAPLFAAAIRLIKQGRGVKLHGRDIGTGLIKTLGKFGPLDLKRAQVLIKIQDWERDQIKSSRESRHASIHDRADCLRVFAEAGSTLQEAIAYADHIFASEGKIHLMTGHKAKGLEFDTVFHLNPWMVPSGYAVKAEKAGDRRQMEQELNLKYVIETRFKREMYFVDLENMQ